MGTSLPPVGVRFQAEGVPQVTGAFKQLEGQARTTGSTISRTFVEGSGRVSAFGRSSITALNATGFAVSQLASTGQVGFRSLASATAGFASFFGPAGLIATGVISLGLVLADFWNRQRKEIEETKRKAEAEFQSLKSSMERDADTRARASDPVGAAQRDLQRLQVRTNANVRRIAEIDADPEGRIDVPLATPIARRRITSARSAERKKLQDEIIADAKAITEANRKLSEAIQAKNAPTAKATTGTRTQTSATHDAEKAARDAARALDAEIDALVQLGKAGQLSGADLERLIRLQEEFTKSVRDSTLSLQERAAASREAARLEGGLEIPTPPITPITEKDVSRQAPGPAKQLPKVDIPVAAPTAATTPVTDGFGDAFAQSLQTGLAAGLTQFLASGDIASMWNSVGSALVAGLATINPWLAVAGGVLQGLIGNLLGGGGNRSPRPRPLPVDIRRVITDPNGRAPRFAMAGPPINVIGINTPRGQRLVGTSNRNFNRRGGGR